MSIYFILLFMATIGMFLAQKTKNSIALSKVFVFFVFLVLVLIAAFRSSNVGTDSNNYVGSFISDEITERDFFSRTSSLELGYQFIEKLASTLSNQYWILFLSIAIIVVYSYLRAIRELSYQYAISVFILISLGTYLFFYNGARQGLAAAIYSIAIIYLIKGNFMKYLFWVLIAFLFHRTVLLTLPFYYIFRLNYSIKNIAITLLVSLGAIYYFAFFLSLFPDTFSVRYLDYQDRGSTGATLLTIFYVVVAVFFILFRRTISKQDIINYDIYLNMTVFSAIVYLVVYLTAQDVNLVRFTLYFSLGYVLIWPIIFRNSKFFSGIIPRLGFFLVHIVFFYIYINKMSNLVPYEFNYNLWISTVF